MADAVTVGTAFADGTLGEDVHEATGKTEREKSTACGGAAPPTGEREDAGEGDPEFASAGEGAEQSGCSFRCTGADSHQDFVQEQTLTRGESSSGLRC